MTVMRVYVDTSVFGGAFDEGFREASRAFFEEARVGRFKIVVSNVVLEAKRRCLRRRWNSPDPISRPAWSAKGGEPMPYMWLWPQPVAAGP